jgi:hypothetical protein
MISYDMNLECPLYVSNVPSYRLNGHFENIQNKEHFLLGLLSLSSINETSLGD